MPNHLDGVGSIVIPIKPCTWITYCKRYKKIPLVVQKAGSRQTYSQIGETQINICSHPVFSRNVTLARYTRLKVVREMLRKEVEAAKAQRDIYREGLERIYQERRLGWQNYIVSQKNRILDWLSSYDSQTKLQNLEEQRVPGTGKWFLDSATFQRWKTGSTQILWCKGEGIDSVNIALTEMQPVLGRRCWRINLKLGKHFDIFHRASVIDHLEHTTEATCALAYVYFDYQDRATQTPANVLSSLLKQLLRQIGSKAWPKELFQRLQSKSSDAYTSTLNSREVVRLMQHCAEQFSCVYLIFDALDECEDPARTKFLTFIVTAAKMEHRLRILFTSRPQLIINESLNVTDTIVIHAQQADIEAYIRASIEYKSYKPSLQEEIVRKLLARADGLYTKISI